MFSREFVYCLSWFEKLSITFFGEDVFSSGKSDKSEKNNPVHNDPKAWGGDIRHSAVFLQRA